MSLRGSLSEVRRRGGDRTCPPAATRERVEREQCQPKKQGIRPWKPRLLPCFSDPYRSRCAPHSWSAELRSYDERGAAAIAGHIPESRGMGSPQSRGLLVLRTMGAASGGVDDACTGCGRVACPRASAVMYADAWSSAPGVARPGARPPARHRSRTVWQGWAPVGR